MTDPEKEPEDGSLPTTLVSSAIGGAVSGITHELLTGTPGHPVAVAIAAAVGNAVTKVLDEGVLDDIVQEIAGEQGYDGQ